MLIKLSKLLLSTFIIYYLWFKEAFGNYPIILYGSVILATLCIVLELFSIKRLTMNQYLIMLFGYGLYSFITGLFVSSDIKWFISILITYFAYVIVCLDCYFIFNKTGDRDWLLNTILLSSILSTLQNIFWGVQYKTEVVVTTMSETNNPNFIGLTMILGIFALVAKERYTKNGLFLTLFFIMTFLYVIVLCGSKKCLICGVLLFVFWLIPILNTEKGFTTRKILLLFGLMVSITTGIYYLTTAFIDTSIYSRFLLFESASYSRMLLYKEAFNFWWSSPIIGIGFGQFQVNSIYRIYSHSTYAEILSCTGLIGCALFFIPFIKLVYVLGKESTKKNQPYRYDYVMCFSMLIIELILGVGQIFIYDFSHLVILLYLFTAKEFINRENDRNIVEGNYIKSRFAFVKAFFKGRNVQRLT